MGRVKLQFRSFYFLHGTPFDGSLGSAASHGCIRMSNKDAIELAMLVHRYSSGDVTADELRRLVADTSATRRITVAELVPLEVRYDVAEVQRGVITLYPDIYGLAKGGIRARALSALVEAGYDTTAIDRLRIIEAVRKARRRPVALTVDSLLPRR